MYKNISILLGGGLKDNLDLPSYVLERVNLLDQQTEKDSLVITSSCYSLNLPPKLNEQKFPVYESIQVARKISRLGFKHVIPENWSHDTIGSAIFTRILITHLAPKPENIFIFTSDFHSDRSKKIFNWAFKKLKPKFGSNVKVFVSESSLSNKKKFDRLEKEKKSTEDFERNFASLSQFNEALYKLLVDHKNYNLSHSSGTDVYNQDYLY